MNEDELLGRMGEMVGFNRHGSQYRGRLLEITWSIRERDDRDVYVTVELPCTLLKLLVPLRDVTHVESSGQAVRYGFPVR
ncbi:hypothetical protein Q5425_26765 [Amycolatopsis sp. A133]|uniref:hypothetical protein n=1 Tax=Amycolatopsis sp. A133 TaxID=3064472 RepID=UPI0027FE40B8|nr:hypothetical protein [Amycolatopsis sp. A133]MDQ7807355.1 hypothetical protein [Amycolatopsis sp. A133]